MIYLDSAATSFYKPEQVEQAVCRAFHTIGNAGRGAHAPTLEASRVLYRTRAKLAKLFHAEHASRIAFTANVTQALNLAIDGLIQAGDHVVT
uniref:aminotransferase class V-fold PLP-dependent enzyme n=1 Tax=Butyricicoccus sp. TaxID=2049021 RepID=UPI003D7ECC10